MATVNPWHKFKSLLPDDAKQVVSVLQTNGDGTSVIQYRNGTTQRVQGNSVAAGSAALLQGGRIVGPAANLPYSEMTLL